MGLDINWIQENKHILYSEVDSSLWLISWSIDFEKWFDCDEAMLSIWLVGYLLS